MTKASDVQGRAIEYAATEALLGAFSGASLTSRAAEMNAVDAAHFASLDEGIRNDFKLYGQVLAHWVSKKLLVGVADVAIDRMDDTCGMGGDSADIKISYTYEEMPGTISLSIKNHHKAAKHQRICTLPEQMGLGGSPKDRKFRAEILAIWNAAMSKAIGQGIHRGKPTKFSHLPESFKFGELYDACNAAAARFMMENQTPERVRRYFDFITGSASSIVAVNWPGRIELRIPKGFAAPARIVSVTSKENNHTTTITEFDNGVKFSTRLHNAEEYLYADKRPPGEAKAASSHDMKYDTHLLDDAGRIEIVELKKSGVRAPSP